MIEVEEEWRKRCEAIIKIAKEIDSDYVKYDIDDVDGELLNQMHWALVSIDSFNKRVQ